MIEVLNWFAADRNRVLGFVLVFLAMCYGLSWITEGLRGEKK